MSPFIEFHARISSFSIQTRLYYEVTLSLRNFDPIHVFALGEHQDKQMRSESSFEELDVI